MKTKFVQPPNKELITALVAALVSYLTTGTLHHSATAVFYAAIFIWSYLEITSGAGWFRKGLGAVVMAYYLIKLAGLK